jgi:ABC-type glycerol-3-phosphate transport system substrate-binding protein
MKKTLACILAAALLAGCAKRDAPPQTPVTSLEKIYHAVAYEGTLYAEESNIFYDTAKNAYEYGNPLTARDNAGAELFSIDLNEQNAALLCLANAADGGVYALTVRGGKVILSRVNAEANALTDERELSSDLSAAQLNSYKLYRGNGEYGLYYSDYSYLYGVGEGELYALFKWSEAGFSADTIDALKALGGGDFAILSGGAAYRLTANVTGAERQTLTLALFHSSPRLAELINAFNRDNPNYKIETVNYTSWGNFAFNETPDGSFNDAMLTKFVTDVMTGNAPDIIDTSGFPMERFAQRGLFVDLYPYLDADPDFQRADFTPSVLNALEIDGKLYETADVFALIALEVPRTLADTLPEDWTLGGMLSIETNGGGLFMTTPEYGLNQIDLFQKLFTLYGEEFIDWDTGDCDFDSPEFIQILEACKRQSNVLAGDLSRKLYVNNLFLATAPAMIGSTLEPAAGEIVLKPFPNVGVKMWQNDGVGLAICSLSENKDAAWDFARIPFTAEHQQKPPAGLQTEGEANVNYPAAAVNLYTRRDTNALVADWLEATTAREAQKRLAKELFSLTENISGTYRIDPSLYNIALSEAKPYFAEAKTAEQTAKLIQSAISIYVSEQK